MLAALIANTASYIITFFAQYVIHDSAYTPAHKGIDLIHWYMP